MHKKNRILLIDDNEGFRKTIEFFLKARKYKVTSAGDGDEGLLRLEEANPDLILLDLKMPHMNGVSFLKVIRKDPRYRDTPVVIITAFMKLVDDIEADRDRLRVLKKPFSLDQLTQTVKQVLDR